MDRGRGTRGPGRDAALALGGIVTELGAAAAAAILAGRVRDERPGARLVAVIASGRNITPDLLLEVLAEPEPGGMTPATARDGRRVAPPGRWSGSCRAPCLVSVGP